MRIAKSTISYEQTGYFSQLVTDYINGKDTLKPFYKHPFQINSFHQVITDKRKQNTDRALLVKVLKEQYAALNDTEKSAVKKNIELLGNERTFVIVTAHQPNLFLGHLYLIYKTISSINLAERLNKEFPGNHFVPVYWMGSEDHDTEELGQVHLFGKTLTWNDGVQGAFGRRGTTSLQPLLGELKTILGESGKAQEVLQLIEDAYRNERTITDATRRILHELFGKYGLVVLDGDNVELKRKFLPVIKKDLFENDLIQTIEQTTRQLEKNYSVQAKPRDINLFYLKDQIRSRIVKEGDEWIVLNTEIRFSASQLEQELETHPERFSPNVVLRPLFQEMILPSVAFVGGGSELAYFMELKSLFERFNLNFPVLVLRNSVLWIDAGQNKKWSNTGFDLSKLFENTDLLVNEFVKKQSATAINTTEERKVIEDFFHGLKQKAEKADKTMIPMVEAEHVRMKKFMDSYEDKLLKAEKKKYDVTIQQIRSVKEKLFPGNSLQERYDNFIPFYFKYGNDFIATLKENLNPVEQQFTVLSEI